MLGLRISALVAGLALVSVAGAQGGDLYLIEPELWLDGEPQDIAPMVIGPSEPGFLVDANNQGRVEDGGWRLEMRARPSVDPLDLSQSLWIDVQLSLFRAGLWEPVLDSMLGVPEGDYSTLSIAPEGQQATPETAEVYLRMRADRLRPVDGPSSADGG